MSGWRRGEGEKACGCKTKERGWPRVTGDREKWNVTQVLSKESGKEGFVVKVVGMGDWELPATIWLDFDSESLQQHLSGLTV